MSRTDCRGVPTSAADDAEVAAFDASLELFLNYEATAGGALKQVLADHPTSVMTAVLRGYMMMMVESVGVRDKVAATAKATLETGVANARERLHLSALGLWASGDVRAAATVWDRLLADYPHDLLALKMHHYTTFWTGRATALLSAVDGVIDTWDESTPGFDHVLGMQSFALNESGHFEQAEVIGRRAVALNDQDLWSIHAVAHSLEMQGALAAGDAFFDVADDIWATKNPFVGHIWWHSALFPWNGGNYDRVLNIYDERLRPISTEFYLDLQNLSSLLTRLELAGVDVGDRWDELGENAASRIGDHVLTFTDVHCAMTLCRTDRRSELEAFTASLLAHRNSLPSQFHTEGLDVAIKLCRGFEDRADDRFEQAAETMLAIRDDLAPIGGSHAQRDLFELLTVDTVAATGDTAMELHLLRSRTRRWPNSVPTWTRYASALSESGDQTGADEANTRALQLKNQDGAE
ncbi:MAG: tetratricopeptide repeat protein [Acidimicrobiales bacterium]